MSKFLILLALVFVNSSCQTLYYNFWETFGVEKRGLLKSNVEDVNDDQEELKEEFKDVLDKVRNKYEFDGGDLESLYDELSGDYDSAERKAKELSDRIDNVEEIAEDLFEEWEEEASEINNSEYRRDSLDKRKKTMTKFNDMLKSMRVVEQSMKPILTTFNDQVLYLKHNLNAKAIGGFKAEFLSIEKEIEKLVKSMEASTRQADQFIQEID